MKKIIICLSTVLALIAISTTASAQTPHPVDTVYGRQITYYYMEWIDTGSDCVEIPLQTPSAELPVEIAFGYYTDTVLPVIGAAVCVITDDNARTAVMDTALTDWEDFLRIYKPMPNNRASLIAEGKYSIADTAHRIYAHAHNCVVSQGYGSPNRDWYLPVYETYFDKTYNVTDSFYVAVACSENAKDQESNMFRHYPVRVVAWDQTGCSIPHLYKFATRRLGAEVWSVGNTCMLIWIWPIIDTTGMNYIAPCDTFFCAGVSDLHVGHPNHVRGGIIDFVWTGAAEHSRWQLSYGPAGTAPGEGSILNCSTPAVDVYGMQDSVHYVCYVRGYCDMCHKWGDWSEGFEYWKEMYTEPAEIRPGRLDRFVTVMPNPATQYVSIMSSFKISRIEAFDLQGALVDEQPVDAFGATLDLSRWPRGTYILNIRTNQGTVARKIVVE